MAVSQKKMEKKVMKKKMIFILSCFLLLIIIGGGYVAFRYSNEQSSSSKISSRAEEFITQRRQSGDEFWNTQSFSEKKQVLGSQVFQTSCFSVNMPFPVELQHQEEKETQCTLRLKIIEGFGQIIIHSQENLTQLDEHTGVTFRRQKRETYKEKKIMSADGEDILMFLEERNGVMFIHDGKNVTTISAREVSNSERAEQLLLDTQKGLQISTK